VSEEWFPKPSELIDPAEPPKPKLGKLSKSPGISIPDALPASWDSRASEAPQAPYRAIWPEIASLDLAETAAVQATAAKRARLRARWAQNKYELAHKLGEADVPRIIAMLRHLDGRLDAGKWISLRWPFHREKSRPLSQPWKRAFKTAARLLHLIEKPAKDERGKSVIKLYLGRDRDVWSLVRLHLGFIDSQPPDKSTESEELLGFKPLKEIEQERKQFEREIVFQCALAREDTELKFKSLPAGAKLTKQSEELARKFADELGAGDSTLADQKLSLQRLRSCASQRAAPGSRASGVYPRKTTASPTKRTLNRQRDGARRQEPDPPPDPSPTSQLVSSRSLVRTLDCWPAGVNALANSQG
jgi:hypothetical protein